MITTEICKQKIVEFCKNNAQHIQKQFCEPLTKEQFDDCQKEKNWKRTSKYKYKHNELGVYPHNPNDILRSFDCQPFDDQLRGYVITDETDEKILFLQVIGE